MQNRWIIYLSVSSAALFFKKKEKCVGFALFDSGLSSSGLWASSIVAVVVFFGETCSWPSSSAEIRNESERASQREEGGPLGWLDRRCVHAEESDQHREIHQRRRGSEQSRPLGDQDGGGRGVAVQAGPPVAAGGGLRFAGGQAPLRRGPGGGHHGGLLPPGLRLPDAVGAGLLRPRLPRRRPQRARHRPGPPLEGALALVRRVHARLLRAPRQGQGPGHHLRQGRLPRALLRRRRPILPRQPGHHRRPTAASHPMRLLPGLPSYCFLPQEGFQTGYGPPKYHIPLANSPSHALRIPCTTVLPPTNLHVGIRLDWIGEYVILHCI